MAKGNKGMTNVSVRRPVPGLVMSPNGQSYAIDWSDLPAPQFYFHATDFMMRKHLSGIVLLFGAVSTFESSPEKFNQAIEVYFPLREAAIYFHKLVFEQLSGNGKTTFYDSVRKIAPIDQFQIEAYRCSLRLPEDMTSSHRGYAANYAAMSISAGQGTIEFYELSPDLIHHLQRGNKVRPGAGINHVMSVIIDPVRMHSLLLYFQDALKDVNVEASEAEAAEINEVEGK